MIAAVVVLQQWASMSAGLHAGKLTSAPIDFACQLAMDNLVSFIVAWMTISVALVMVLLLVLSVHVCHHGANQNGKRIHLTHTEDRRSVSLVREKCRTKAHQSTYLQHQ